MNLHYVTQYNLWDINLLTTNVLDMASLLLQSHACSLNLFASDSYAAVLSKVCWFIVSWSGLSIPYRSFHLLSLKTVQLCFIAAISAIFFWFGRTMNRALHQIHPNSTGNIWQRIHSWLHDHFDNSHVCSWIINHLSHKHEVLFRHPVDARAQHHNEPYATNVPGGISDVSPSADGVEDIGEVLGFSCTSWLGVDISRTTSHLERLTDSALCHQGAANSDPKASRMPHSRKYPTATAKAAASRCFPKSVAFVTSCHPTWALPGTCTWIELSPHAARTSAAVSSDKPPLARTAWASCKACHENCQWCMLALPEPKLSWRIF